MGKGDSVEIEDSKLATDFRATIPKAIRALIGVQPGDSLTWFFDKKLDGAWVKKKED